MQVSHTTKRCLGHVATVMIRPDGGRTNISAKILATFWYLLIFPDAQSRLQKHVQTKRLPWFALTRLFGIGLAVTNIVNMPMAWLLLFMGKKNASRICTCGVLMNPPTMQLGTILVTELVTSVIRKGHVLINGVLGLLKKPFAKSDSQTQQEEEKNNQIESS